MTPADWHALVSVRVAGGSSDQPPVLGTYARNGALLTFVPRFGFDPGRQYIVTVDPSRLPVPRDEPVLAIAVGLPAENRSPTVEVTRIFPSADSWPENLLRFYIEFSGPMAHVGGLDYVRLLDENGHEVVDPFLPLDVEFWDPEFRRYTMFLDPGRVKTDILPNREMGRPLVEGRRYTIEVDAAWPDEYGQPLIAPFRKTFDVATADLTAVDPSSWTVMPAAAGGRDPVVVTFPSPLDHGLLGRAVGAATPDGAFVPGAVTVGANETEVRFVPDQPWSAGDYDIVVLSILEDPAGNRIGRLFEVDAFEQTDVSPVPARTTIRFVVR